MGEQRAAPRWHVIYHLRVFERDTDGLLGHVIDISTTGMRLGSERELALDAVYRVWMAIPFDDDDHARVQFDIRVVRVGGEESGDLHEYGCRITGLLPRAMLTVQDLVDDLALNQ